MTRRPRRSLQAKCRVWLELSGRAVFGDGKARLLEAIRQTGSLKTAAAELGMSYRGLWGRLREMERRLGFKLVARKVGGAGGGGSQLTEKGGEFLARYRRFRASISRTIETRAAKVFGD